MQLYFLIKKMLTYTNYNQGKKVFLKIKSKLLRRTLRNRTERKMNYNYINCNYFFYNNYNYSFSISTMYFLIKLQI